jgi:hypothetical protein
VRVHTVGDSYALTRTEGNRVIIGPAGGTPAVLAAIAAAGDHDVRLALFGGHPLLPVLVRAGLRIVEQDTFMSRAAPPVDPARYLPSGSLG